LGDFPSLKDLETSNILTKSNINVEAYRVKILGSFLQDKKRAFHLDIINKKI
jgi:hypothetical protein